MRWRVCLLADGDRLAAAREVKAAWRSEELGEATEAMAYEEFRELLAREDHRARMDKRIGAKEISAAMRAAKRLGDDDFAIVKACSAVKGDADKALGKLNDVPEEARGDLGYVLCRVKWAMKKDKIVDAAKMVIAAQPETMAQQDTDEWWRDRRTLSRKLLDMGEFQMAYDVVKDAATPGLEAYRADYAFMPGWIALRYLNDPATARKVFCRYRQGPRPIRSRWRAPITGGPRGGSDGRCAGCALVLRGFCKISDRLLRAAVADQARHRADRAARAEGGCGDAHPTNACAPSTCSMPSASATCR